MNIPDHISESLETIFWVKMLKFFDADPDPGIFFDPGRRQERVVTYRYRFRYGTFPYYLDIFLFSCLRVPVIVEKSPKARIGDLDKKKYLVPSGDAPVF